MRFVFTTARSIPSITCPLDVPDWPEKGLTLCSRRGTREETKKERACIRIQALSFFAFNRFYFPA
jgi:hypothetical protein